MNPKEKATNFIETGLGEADTRSFFGHEMRREKLEHIVTFGVMKGKCSTRKQREKVLAGLIKWLKVGCLEGHDRLR